MGFPLKNYPPPSDADSAVLSTETMKAIILPEVLDSDKYDIEALFQTIKDNDHEKTAIILGAFIFLKKKVDCEKIGF